MRVTDRIKNGAGAFGDFIKKHKKAEIVGVSIVLVVALFFVALYFTGVFDNRARAIEELEQPELTLNPAFGDESFISVEIKGKIRNSIHATVKLVVFRFALYDADGKLIENVEGEPIYATDSVQNLTSGKEYAYTATALLPASVKTPLTFRPVKSTKPE